MEHTLFLNVGTFKSQHILILIFGVWLCLDLRIVKIKRESCLHLNQLLYMKSQSF